MQDQLTHPSCVKHDVVASEEAATSRGWQMSRLRTAGVQARACSRRAQAMVDDRQRRAAYPFRICLKRESDRCAGCPSPSIQDHDQQGAS